MAEKVVITLEVDAKTGVATVKGMEKAIGDANQATEKASDNLLDFNKKLDELSGGAVTAFKNFVGGARKAIKSMGVLRAAAAATGIGLLVTAAAALVEYFTNFEKPLKVVDQVMNAIGGAVNALVNSFGKLLSGDFVGFFSDVADGAIEAVEATNKLYEAQLQIFEIQKRTIVQNAELRAELEAGQKIAADTTLSLEERLAGQEAVNRSSEQLIENERQLAAAELQRLEAEKDLSNNYIERRELEIQIEQTTANLISIEAELGRQRQDAAKAEREIRDQAKREEEAAAKTEKERIASLVEARKTALAEIQKALRTSTEQEIFEVNSKYDELIMLARKYGQDTVELERLRQRELRAITEENVPIDRVETELQIERDIVQGTLQIRRDGAGALTQLAEETTNTRVKLTLGEAAAQADIYAGLTSSVAQLLGQQTAAGKAAAVAAATISTFAGAAKAIEIYGPTPLGFAALGTAVATGIAQVRQILSTKVPGAAGGGGGGASVNAPRAPQAGSAIGLINPNQQGEITGSSLAQGLTEQPIRAFVVSENVTDQQDLDNQIQANAQFG